MMKKENAGAATFCPRRRRSLWPAEKGIAQKHAERCIGQRSALHQPSQCTASGIAARCILWGKKQPALSKAGGRAWIRLRAGEGAYL